MRKLMYSAMTLAAAAAFATPALAQPPGYGAYDYAPPAQHRAQHAKAAAETGAGVVAGTTIGVGIAEGWGPAAVTAAAPATVAGAAAVGGLAGMGAIAAVDAAIEPCRGLAAMFGVHHGECADGNYVGPQAARGPAPRHYYR